MLLKSPGMAKIMSSQYRSDPDCSLAAASNLPAENWAAAKLIAAYKCRMQIEECSRDVKSEQVRVIAMWWVTAFLVIL